MRGFVRAYVTVLKIKVSIESSEIVCEVDLVFFIEYFHHESFENNNLLFSSVENRSTIATDAKW